MARRTAKIRSATPALVLLNEHGIDYQVHEFHHDPSTTDFGREAAQHLSVDATQVFKTLVFDVDDGYAVAVVPTSSTVAPKQLAKALGARRAALADSADAERLSGSVTGAISPFGLRQVLPIVVDTSALDFERVYVSAGRRGLEVCVATCDLVEVTRAQVAPIAASSGGR